MVIPGEAVGGPGLKPGPGTFRQGDTIVAALLGVRSERDGIVTIIPANGRYMPEPGDPVIGEVVDFGPSHWLVDINAPYPAPLHATESPWDVEFGDTACYMQVGDVILAFILSVDEAKKVQLTMRDREARKVQGGIMMQISPTKVPRVIGKQGSMISMIKEMTRSRIFVGQNGVIWIDGDDANAALAERAIRFIEERAQAFGVTEAVRALLERSAGRGGTDP